MALIGINPGQERERKPSTLEQIALGVDVASKILGTGLNAYDTFAIKKPHSEAENRYHDAMAKKALMPHEESELDKLVKVMTLQKGQRELDQPNLTPGQTALDKKFADDYNDFVAQGGQAQFQKNMAQLKDARDKMAQNPNLTGGITDTAANALGGNAFSYLKPELAAIKDQILEPVQGNLKLTLGAQFTEKEGSKVEGRSFNPALPTEKNVEKIDRLMKQMQEQFDAKLRAVNWWEQHKGTLNGFEGHVPNISTLDSMLPADTKKSVDKATQGVGNTPHPQVTQGGHVYNWNKETGQYE